jgi:hypothetical protein
MRDDEPWYQDCKSRILNASLELDRKKTDDLVIGNAIYELEMAIDVLRGRQEEIYDENEKERMRDESIST